MPDEPHSGAHLPIFQVTIGDDLPMLPLSKAAEAWSRENDVTPAICYGSEDEARRALAAMAGASGRPAAVFRIVRFEVADVMEG